MQRLSTITIPIFFIELCPFAILDLKIMFTYNFLTIRGILKKLETNVNLFLGTYDLPVNAVNCCIMVRSW